MSEMIVVFVLGFVFGGLIVAGWRLEPRRVEDYDDTEQRVGRPL